MLHYDWTEIKRDPHAATPAEALAGAQLMRELGAKWWMEGYQMFQAGRGLEECWSPEHRAGWQQADVDAAEAVWMESVCKPGLGDLVDHRPAVGEYGQRGFWAHEDLPLWTAGGAQ